MVELFAERSGISGWWIGKANRDDLTPPSANSPTLDVLDHLAGAARTPWGRIEGVDFAVAATARAVIVLG